MLEEYSVAVCDICHQILGWYYFDKSVQVGFKMQCRNCHIRLMRQKKYQKEITIMYTQCDKCGAIETTLTSVLANCMFCKKGIMREVVKEL